MKRLVFMLVLSLAPAACQKPSFAPDTTPRPPPDEVWLPQDTLARSEIAVMPARRGQLDLLVTATGRVAFDDAKVSRVYSPVSGRVLQIAVKLGQKVAKGAELMRLESPDLGVFSAELEKSNADYEAALSNYQRMKSLYEGRAAAQRDFEAAEDTLARARSEWERAKKKAKLFTGDAQGIDKVTQTYVVRAPIAGEVIAHSVSPGMEVIGQYGGSGEAQELFTVGNLDSVWLVSDVFEVDLARVHKDDPVTARVIAYPDDTFAGKVDWIADDIDPSSRTARVRCVLNNADGKLKPEMFATVGIAVEKVDALALPRTAVYHLRGKTLVYVQTAHAPAGFVGFAMRYVEVEERGNGEQVAILRGVQDGENIVVSGGILLTGSVSP